MRGLPRGDYPIFCVYRHGENFGCIKKVLVVQWDIRNKKIIIYHECGEAPKKKTEVFSTGRRNWPLNPAGKSAHECAVVLIPAHKANVGKIILSTPFCEGFYFYEATA